MSFVYETKGGRYYRIKKKNNKSSLKKQSRAEVSRISCEEYDKQGRSQKIPKKGDKVTIIIKPYSNYNCSTGIVKNVLTRKKRHTRGHKVCLQNGKIGRVLKVLEQ